MSVPLLDLRAQYKTIRDDVLPAMERVAESQQLTLGPEVEAFEKEAAAWLGAKYAVACASGTDALLMALMALRVGPGDEVIVPSYTFFATAGGVARLGAKPVFAEMDPVSFNIDPSHAASLVNERTKAIIPVHLYGQCADMDAIGRVAAERGVAVIEDAAQAIGAEWKGKRTGQLGDAACFSFYPTKNLGAFGDAGMTTANDDALAADMRALRVHGTRVQYHHVMVGGNFRMDGLQGAVLRIKLRHLDDWTAARQRVAERYNRMFEEAGVALSVEEVVAHGRDCGAKGCPLQEDERIALPLEVAGPGRAALRIDGAPFPGHRHVYNYYVIRTWRRDAVIASLRESAVGFSIYYPVPLHLQECFADLGHKPGDLPASECAANTTLALPIYPELTEAQQREVVEAVMRGTGARLNREGREGREGTEEN
jgi:dTDP-4-amino-4,6-dideoxygalactose transaminase